MNENSPLGLIKEIIGNLNNQLSLIYFIFIIFIFSSLQEKTFSQLRELMFAIIPVNIENYLIDIFSYHISITKFLLFINFIGWIPALIMLLIIGFSYFKNFSPDLFNNNILSNLLVLSQKYIHISFMILLINILFYILLIGNMSVLEYFYYIYIKFEFLTLWLLLSIALHLAAFKDIDLSK